VRTDSVTAPVPSSELRSRSRRRGDAFHSTRATSMNPTESVDLAERRRQEAENARENAGGIGARQTIAWAGPRGMSTAGRPGHDREHQEEYRRRGTGHTASG